MSWSILTSCCCLMGRLSIQTVPTVVGGNTENELREAIDEGNGLRLSMIFGLVAH